MNLGILGRLLVFTATLLNKKEGFSEYSRLDIRRVNMSDSSKMNNESATAYTYRGTKTTTYKAPTLGLEHTVFKYGEQMKPRSFKTVMESMAKHMARILKKGGPEAAKSIKKQEWPKYKEPDKPKMALKNKS